MPDIYERLQEEINIRIFQDQRARIKKHLENDPGRYHSESHFIRIAITRYLNELDSSEY